MQYKIEISGRGGEIVIGKVNRTIYDYFSEKELDIGDYASDYDNEQEIPSEYQPFEPGSWFECDDIAHNYGAIVTDSYITITDITNNKILVDNVSLDDLITQGVDVLCEDEIYPEDILEDGEAYFIGQSYEKGHFYSAYFYAEEFDLSKLIINSNDINGWDVITSVFYDDNELEDLGELSTDGKGSDFELVLVER